MKTLIEQLTVVNKLERLLVSSDEIDIEIKPSFHDNATHGSKGATQSPSPLSQIDVTRKCLVSILNCDTKQRLKYYPN